MIEDSEEKLGTSAPRRRRRRVQSRSMPPKDIWDRSEQEIDFGSSKTRRKPTKKSVPLVLFQIVACLALGLSVPLIIKWSMDRQQVGNPDHVLKNLSIHTDGDLDEQQILRQSGLKRGLPLDPISAEHIQSRIEQLPRVESAIVRKQLPESLAIRVTERVPVAWLSCPAHKIRPLRDQGMLIDQHGFVLRCHELKQPWLALPTIEINQVASPIEGVKLESNSLIKSLQLVGLLRPLESRFETRLIDIRPLKDWGLLCYFSNEVLATFHVDQLETGLANFVTILKETRRKNQRLATVNLAVMKNIPVTFHPK